MAKQRRLQADDAHSASRLPPRSTATVLAWDKKLPI
jgi:hypothetical protein